MLILCLPCPVLEVAISPRSSVSLVENSIYFPWEKLVKYSESVIEILPMSFSKILANSKQKIKYMPLQTEVMKESKI